MNRITNKQVAELGARYGIEYALLKAFIEVESGGVGFDKTTDKIIIQFEPSWYKKKAPYAPSGAWSLNKVENQRREWIAFNDAFKGHPNAAMESTSIGMPQIMGFHYKMLGYKTVGAMWDDFKKGEYEQIHALVRFILATPDLLKALKKKDFHTAASIYNGKSYKEMAKIWGREPYNISLEKAYIKYSKQVP